MKQTDLSTTARRVLGDLARPGWCLRRNSIGAWELCERIARSGAGVGPQYVAAWEARGWIAPDGPSIYRITALGRQVVEGAA